MAKFKLETYDQNDLAKLIDKLKIIRGDQLESLEKASKEEIKEYTDEENSRHYYMEKYVYKVLDNWKGYPLDSRFPVFTGNKDIIGSSVFRTKEIGNRFWVGEGIYLCPEESVFVYLHEVGHGVDFASESHGENDDRTMLEQEYKAEKYACAKYGVWQYATDDRSIISLREEHFLKLIKDLLECEKIKPEVAEEYNKKFHTLYIDVSAKINSKN